MSAGEEGRTVAATDQVWKEVGERFAALGQLLKDRYQQQAESGTEAEARPHVEDALHRLADALDEVVTAAGETVRDAAVAEEARRAARSLGDALSATFEDVHDGLRDRFKQTGDTESRGELPGD
jgi:hypothetical protein